MKAILIGCAVIASALWTSVLAGEQQDPRTVDLQMVADRAATTRPRLQTPRTEYVDIYVEPVFGNRLALCHLKGQVTLWVSRAVSIRDEMGEELGTIEAGLEQFGTGTTLEGCLSDGATLDLSGQFANFRVAGAASDGGPSREVTIGLASQLAQGFYHLAEPEGTFIPLVDGIKTTALGSVAHEFAILLVGNGTPGSFDAVIQRETVRTKFSSRLPEADRHASRLKWASRR